MTDKTPRIRLPHLPVHAMVYGLPGSKKSTFAASFDVCGPGRVDFFDGVGKEAPYLRRGDRFEDDESPKGVPIKRVFKGKTLLWEIAYYYDDDPEKPDAWRIYREEFRALDPAKWATYVFDSITGANLAAYYDQRYRVNKGDENAYQDKKSMQWRSGATDDLERALVGRLRGFPYNAVIIGHIEEKEVKLPMARDDGAKKIEKRVESAIAGDEDGERATLVRTISAPGRLAKRNILLSQFAECYRAYATRNGEGKTEWWLQTEDDGAYIAQTQIPAPDPCKPKYESLFKKVE